MDQLTLKVEAHKDERLVFMVESESGREPYRVDLTEYWGNGKCNCKHFECRMEPEVSNNKENVGDKNRCKHIKAARLAAGEFLLNETIAHAIELQKEKHPRHD